MAERGRPKAPLTLTDDERQTLQRWSRRSKTSQALALRCRIVLAWAEGATNQAVAEQLGIWPQTVAKWRGRFVRERLEGCRMSRGRAGPGRSPMTRLSRC
jgi:FixJ family two-component response regulator